MDLEESEQRPFLLGKTAAVIQDVQPAKQIIDEMVAEAVTCLNKAVKFTSGPSAKL